MCDPELPPKQKAEIEKPIPDIISIVAGALGLDRKGEVHPPPSHPVNRYELGDHHPCGK